MNKFGLKSITINLKFIYNTNLYTGWKMLNGRVFERGDWEFNKWFVVYRSYFIRDNNVGAEVIESFGSYSCNTGWVWFSWVRLGSMAGGCNLYPTWISNAVIRQRYLKPRYLDRRILHLQRWLNNSEMFIGCI